MQLMHGWVVPSSRMKPGYGGGVPLLSIYNASKDGEKHIKTLHIDAMGK